MANVKFQTNEVVIVSKNGMNYKVFLQNGKYGITKQSLLDEIEFLKGIIENINFDNIEENGALMKDVFYVESRIADAIADANNAKFSSNTP